MTHVDDTAEKAVHGGTISAAVGGFTERMFAPLIDLGPASDGPLHLYRVEFAFDDLVEKPRARPNLQRVLPAAFRTSLLHRVGRNDVDVADPRDVARDRRTPRWQELCDRLDHAERERGEALLGILRILGALGFHALVIRLGERADTAPREQMVARRYLVETSRYLRHLDYREPYDISQMASVAMAAPQRSSLRANAMLHMVVQSARDARDALAVRHWRGLLHAELQAMEHDLDRFDWLLLMSRFWRAASFLPQILNDRTAVVNEMDECERLARALAPQGRRQEILAKENLYPVLESRAKEALWLGDNETALRRARDVVNLDPLDAKGRIELAEVLAKQGQFALARDQYLDAIRLGPPGIAISYFMAGQCHEKLGDDSEAILCYLSSLEADPGGLAPRRRLEVLAGRQVDRPLSDWLARSPELV